jgi:hypothetical protein
MSNTTILPYKKDDHFENILVDLNDALRPVELEYIARFDQLQYPVILIAGTQRSGTTLLMQLLIAYFEIGYVSNLMARFWQAPYIGALLFKELHQKQYSKPPGFTSALGTTYGYEGPHEFGYFWQHWFPYNDTHQTSAEDLEQMNVSLFRQELAAMESAFDAPLAFKNPIVFSLNIEALARILPTAIFLICRREPIYVAQSTLLSRIKFHGRKDRWFSVKPEEYLWLKDRPYLEQIAGQIFYTEKRIRKSLAKLEPGRYLMIEYENLCRDPKGELGRIQEMVTKSGYELIRTDYRPESFQCTNVQRIDDGEFEQLQEACALFYKSKTQTGRES